MTRVVVTFGHGGDSLALSWQVVGSPLGMRWIRALSAAIPHGIFENDRLYNFPYHHWNNRARIADELGRCMRSIEGFYPNFFSKWPSQDMGITDTNDLHVYFERLRGSIEEPSPLFVNAPESIRTEINRYNILIHRYESRLFSGGTNKRPRVVCTFNEENRQPLQDQDYDLFVLHNSYGDLMINYPQVGKTFLEAFHDDDHVVTDSGIRPMRYLAAGFRIAFSEISVEQAACTRRSFDSWFDASREHFNSLGFFKEDNKISLGYLVVATLIDQGIPRHALESEIGRLGVISSVEII